jgi:hypothetical protein
MAKTVIADQAEQGAQIYAHLEPIVDALLQSGNNLSRQERWGSTKDGFVCCLEGPIDFALVRRSFALPESIVLVDQKDLISCRKTWATINGSSPRRGEW